MNAVGFDKLLRQFGGLSVEQLNQAKGVLSEREGEVEGLLVLRDREQNVSSCAHCNDQRIVKHGRRRDRQRFRCKTCKRTSTVLTGSPLAGLRLPEKHIENARCMAARLSRQEAALRLDVSVSTAFRWRHRFLERLAGLDPEQLAGVVEVDETFFLESFKGQRQGLPRKAKKRGTPAARRGLSREQIPVLVARDRATGATLAQRLEFRDAKHIGPVLIPKLSKDAVMVTDGASAYKVLGRAHRIEVRQVPRDPKHRTTGLTHLNNVNAYDQRLKKWMGGFVGVATKYLQNYLGWHRWLDANSKTKIGRRFLQASIGWAMAA